jgi:hypothetical protein
MVCVSVARDQRCMIDKDTPGGPRDSLAGLANLRDGGDSDAAASASDIGRAAGKVLCRRSMDDSFWGWSGPSLPKITDQDMVASTILRGSE